jgi:hypothetical protein
VKRIWVSIFLVFFSFNSFADDDENCAWFPSNLYRCDQDYKCSYQATPDGPVLERELITSNGCLHKEGLPGGLKLECEWWGQVERAHVRMFYMELIEKGQIDPTNKYQIENKSGPNPISLGIDLGKCKVTKDGEEMNFDDQSLNQIMLGTVTSETKQKVKTEEELKNEIRSEAASSADNKGLSKRIRAELEGSGKLESLDVKAWEFTSDAMEQVFDSDFFVADAAINGQRPSKVIMVWGSSGIDIIQKIKDEDTVVPGHIQSSFILDSEEKAKLLHKALRHVYARQYFDDNPADGFTRTVETEGAVWTIYDAHKERPDMGYTVTTDGQGKVLSISNYFVFPE